MKKFLLLVVVIFQFAFTQTLELQPFATGISQPIVITNAGDERLFVVEKQGKIRIINPNGTIVSTPFLDIQNKINGSGERGFLGLAFPTDYQENGIFYIHYSNLQGNTTIARYSVSDNPDIADANSEEIIYTFNQPYGNHNGGTLTFGPDGYLWIGLGDGGSAGDPQANGQNINTALGKILRLDVSPPTGYAIPADNPFVNQNGLDEIWAYGLRNPWKFSIDLTENEVWIADVGQNQIEEINRQSTNEAGLNYGWRCYEGNDAYNLSGCAASSEMTFPVATYFHTNGRCSITGGNVYRGSSYPNLQGKYLFADYCSDEVGYIDPSDNSLTWAADFSDRDIGIAAFGEDMNHEMYLSGPFSNTIYKIIDSSMGTNEVKSSAKVKVHVNKDKQNLQVQSNINLSKYHIFNAQGQILKEGKLNSKSANISLSGLKTGVYFVQFESDKKIFSFKFLR